MNTKLTISIVISSVISLIAGVCLGIVYAPTQQPIPVSDSTAYARAVVDSLISDWMNERAVDGCATASMNDESGLYRIGFISDTVRGIAKRIEREYQVPASVMLAQFVIESSFGTRNLGAQNFFGHTAPVSVKFGNPPPRFVQRLTKEFEHGKFVVRSRRFAKYRNIEDCFETHGRLLKVTYAYAARLANDPQAYARALTGVYATDPKYAFKLITIMNRYKLKD